MARTQSRPSPKQPQQVAPARRSIPWKPIVGAIVVIGGLAALVALDPPPPGTEFADQGNFHLSTPSDPHVPYNSSPPSSGPHFGGLAEWGVHTDVVPPEIFVHNLEDGGIVFAYDCPDGCADLQSGLEEYVTAEGGRKVLTPFEGIADPQGTSYRAAAVAWTRVFYFDELDDATLGEIEAFVRLYEGLDHHVGAN